MTDTAPADPQPTKSADRSALSVDQFVRKYPGDAARGDRVQQLAADLFQSAPTAHGLPTNSADVISATVRLRDVGLDDLSRGRGEAIILQHGIAGFDRDDSALVATAVGLLQDGGRAQSSGAEAAAAAVAALVSVADALDAGGSVLRVSNVDDTRSRIRVYMRGSGADAARWAAFEDASARSSDLPRRLQFLDDVGSRYYIRPGDRMQAAAYKVFARLHRDALSRRDGVRKDTDIEDLHKFRVATRRLRAALRAFRPVFGRELLSEATSSARAVARATNGARDLDVFLECFDGASTLSRVPALMARIRRDRARAMRATLSVVDGAAFDTHERAMDRLLTETHPKHGLSGRRRASHRARREAPRMVRQRLRRVMTYERELAAADDRQRHDLRIAAKQLRYVLEFFADVLPADTQQLINKMKALQDSLGEANDCAVQTAYVVDAKPEGGSSNGMSGVERAAVRSLVAELELRRQRALSLFRVQWTEFTAEAHRRLPAAEPSP